jgi:hypothetical protein
MEHSRDWVWFRAQVEAKMARKATIHKYVLVLVIPNVRLLSTFVSSRFDPETRLLSIPIEIR